MKPFLISCFLLLSMGAQEKCKVRIQLSDEGRILAAKNAKLKR
jgi:hypothetical protein